MTRLQRFVSFGFCGCPGCGSYFYGVSLLCEICEDRMIAIARPRVDRLGNWKIRSLFSWNPGESDRLSSLLLALKGPRRQAAWQFWARLFALHHGPGLPHGPLFSVAAPLGHKAKRDHAQFWTAALADELGMHSFGSIFRKEAAQNQRRQTIEERELGPKLVKLTAEPVELSEDPWIMGDDILTTGSTARAVHRGLGRPLFYEVWCLALRTKPSGHDSFE